MTVFKKLEIAWNFMEASWTRRYSAECIPLPQCRAEQQVR